MRYVGEDVGLHSVPGVCFEVQVELACCEIEYREDRFVSTVAVLRLCEAVLACCEALVALVCAACALMLSWRSHLDDLVGVRAAAHESALCQVLASTRVR